MVKAKTSTNKQDAPIVAAPVVAEKTATKTKKTVKAAPKTVEPVVQQANVESVKTEVQVKPETQEEGDQPLAEQSTEFLGKLQQIGALISSLKSEYRTLDKKWTRELKVAQKLNSKRKRKSGNRAPSGFVKPTRISDELAKFLGKDLGSEMARTEVTRDINKYIRTHNLQDSANGRKINPDAKLATLLKLKKSDELTYFNLQRYMSPHFAKASAAIKTEATTA